MPRVLLLEPLADVASTSFCCCVASAEPPSARVSGLLPRGREQFESEAASSGSYFTNPGLFKSAGISDLFSILPFLGMVSKKILGHHHSILDFLWRRSIPKGPVFPCMSTHGHRAARAESS